MLLGLTVWGGAQAEPPVAALHKAGPAPVLDGRLDEAFWAAVPPVAAFRQAVPVAGGEPSRRTELRVAHDGVRLYLAVRAFEPSPAGIVARTLRRDAEALESDDHLALVLDPQGSGRNGFVFRVNALGAQRDALVSDGSISRPDWDGLWESAALIDGQGWSAELAIPLSLLAAPADGRPWGWNVERFVAASGERMRLFNAVAEREIDSLTDAGPLAGVTPLGSGWGLRLQPALRWSAGRTDGRRTPARFEPSLDASWQLTPTLSATLTLNSDFSDADLDDRIVSLSRFELFRPEKRVFFTQDAGRFSFGGLEVDEPVLVPFFSRRIGLGQSLDAGLKLSGSAGPLELGAFAVQVPGRAGATAARMGVVRGAVGLGQAQRLGLIATQGTADGLGDNRLAGLDYQFRSTGVLDGRTLEAYAWTQRSRDSALGAGDAHGASLRFPNLGLTGQLDWTTIDAAFRPALGYVRETGVRLVDASLGWWHRTTEAANLIPSLLVGARKRHDASERSRYAGFNVEWSNDRGDYVVPEWRSEHEVLAAALEPLPGARVAAGEHRFSHALLSAGLAPSREWSAEATLRGGGYYGGNLSEQTVKIAWRPTAHWSVSTGLARQRLRSAGGAFTARTASLRLDHAASTRSAQSLVVQHDNVSRQTLVGLRSRWSVALGQELRLALDHARPGPPARTSDYRATVAMSWSFER